MNRALIHVDILNDFITGTLPVPGGEEVVAIANELTRDAVAKQDVVVFLADCHPPNTEHFEKWPVHCLRFTKGQSFHRNLWVPDGSFVVFKGTGKEDDGYSGFDLKNVDLYIKSRGILFDLVHKNLEYLLGYLDVDTVDIDGLATNYCDKATALDSVKLEFRTRLILDACRAIPYPSEHPDSEENALREMKEAGVEITTTAKVLY